MHGLYYWLEDYQLILSFPNLVIACRVSRPGGSSLSSGGSMILRLRGSVVFKVRRSGNRFPDSERKRGCSYV